MERFRVTRDALDPSTFRIRDNVTGHAVAQVFDAKLARQFAASGKMLEALNNIADSLRWIEQHGGLYSVEPHLLALADAAIAAATGEGGE